MSQESARVARGRGGGCDGFGGAGPRGGYSEAGGGCAAESGAPARRARSLEESLAHVRRAVVLQRLCRELDSWMRMYVCICTCSIMLICAPRVVETAPGLDRTQPRGRPHIIPSDGSRGDTQPRHARWRGRLQAAGDVAGMDSRHFFNDERLFVARIARQTRIVDPVLPRQLVLMIAGHYAPATRPSTLRVISSCFRAPIRCVHRNIRRYQGPEANGVDAYPTSSAPAESRRAASLNPNLQLPI